MTVTTTDPQPNRNNNSSRYFHIEAATSSMQNAGVAYQAPSMIAAGAGAQTVALFSALTNLAFGLLLIKLPWLIESKVSPKRATLAMALGSMAGWVPLIAVLLFSRLVNPIWLIPLWILSLLPVTMLIPVRDSWLARTIPPANMGRYLGLRTAISAAAYLATLIIAGFVLDAFAGPILASYGWLFAVIFAAAIGSVLLYRKITAPPPTNADSKATLGFGAFLRETRRGYLGRFILYVSGLTLAANIASPFFSVYMLRELHFNYWTLTLVMAAEYVARVITLAIASRYIDKLGSLKVMGMASYLIPIGPVLWLFSSNIFYIVAIQLLAGTAWASFELSTQTHIYKTAPQHNLFRYIVYQKSFSALAVAVGALAGAGLISVVFPISGSHILGIFLLSAVLRILVVRLFFHRLAGKEPPDRIPASRPVAVPTAWAFPAPNGLFYRPEEWLEYAMAVTPAAHVGLSARRLPPEDGPVVHTLRELPPLVRKLVLVKAQASKDGLFYQRTEWLKYHQGSLQSVAEEQAKRDSLRARLDEGPMPFPWDSRRPPR